MREVSIVGVGIHKFGRFGEKPFTEIGVEAALMALKDANMAWGKIQAAFCSRVNLPSTTGLRVLTQLGRTGIPIVDVEAACAAGGAALRQAHMLVASGFCDYAMAIGVEKMPRGFIDPEMLYDKWQVHVGLSQIPMYWAMRAQRHMYEYGTTVEQMGMVAVKNHKNSVHNPYAMYQRAFTLEEVLNSAMVCDPIRLLMICAPDEGAAAVIVCPSQEAHKWSSKPIKIAACVHKIALYPHTSAPAYTGSAKVVSPFITEYAANAAYEEAGLGPEDLDVVELQDTEAHNEIEATEYLGLCSEGGGGALVESGATEIGGRIPVNPSGGLISKGEPIGASHLGQVFEIVTQLRGQAGERQVDGAKVGLCHVLGAGGNCAITILKR